MKIRNPKNTSEPQNQREKDRVTRNQAVESARAALARNMSWCDVYDKPPENMITYNFKKPRVPCWYVMCGPDMGTCHTGGGGTLLCISRRTGRILRVCGISSE